MQGTRHNRSKPSVEPLGKQKVDFLVILKHPSGLHDRFTEIEPLIRWRTPKLVILSKF